MLIVFIITMNKLLIVSLLHNLVPYRRIVAGAPAMRRFLIGDPGGIRTHILDVRGRPPKPLEDGAISSTIIFVLTLVLYFTSI